MSRTQFLLDLGRVIDLPGGLKAVLNPGVDPSQVGHVVPVAMMPVGSSPYEHEFGHDIGGQTSGSLSHTLNLVESMLDDVLKPGEDRLRDRMKALRRSFTAHGNLNADEQDELQAIFSLVWDRQMQPAGFQVSCQHCLDAKRRFGLPLS